MRRTALLGLWVGYVWLFPSACSSPVCIRGEEKIGLVCVPIALRDGGARTVASDAGLASSNNYTGGQGPNLDAGGTVDLDASRGERAEDETSSVHADAASQAAAVDRPDVGPLPASTPDAGAAVPTPNPTKDAGTASRDCFTDSDGDGRGTKQPAFCPAQSGTGAAQSDDCDDTNPKRSPALKELCDDSIDNDCDGAVNEDCVACASGQDCAAPPAGCDAGPCDAGTPAMECPNGFTCSDIGAAVGVPIKLCAEGFLPPPCTATTQCTDMGFTDAKCGVVPILGGMGCLQSCK